MLFQFFVYLFFLEFILFLSFSTYIHVHVFTILLDVVLELDACQNGQKYKLSYNVSLHKYALQNAIDINLFRHFKI